MASSRGGVEKWMALSRGGHSFDSFFAAVGRENLADLGSNFEKMCQKINEFSRQSGLTAEKWGLSYKKVLKTAIFGEK